MSGLREEQTETMSRLPEEQTATMSGLRDAMGVQWTAQCRISR
jgi:hypothetical protein